MFKQANKLHEEQWRVMQDPESTVCRKALQRTHNLEETEVLPAILLE